MFNGALTTLCSLEGPLRWMPIIGAASGIACLVVQILESLDLI
jgi:hypothetical protein